MLPTIETLRKKYPGYSDDEILQGLQATQYPDYSIGEIKGAIGYKPPKRSLMAAANDLVIEGANAAAGFVGSAANFVSPGNKFSEGIEKNIIQAGEEKQSDFAKDVKQRFRDRVAGADGVGEELAAVGQYVLDAPGLAAAQAVGSFVGPGAAIKSAGGAARVFGAGERAIAGSGMAAGSATGAAASGGDAAQTAYDLVIKAGGTEEQATDAARQASVIPAVIGGAGGVMGAERVFAGAKGFTGNTVTRALKTGLSEAAQEGIEEGATQYEGQRAAMPYDPSIDPSKGVAAAAGMGAALGGITGAGVALISPEQHREQAIARLSQSKTVDEAIAAATDLASPPASLMAKARMTAGQENNALTTLEQQAQGDLADIRQQGRMDKTGLAGMPRATATIDEGSANVTDSPFADRVLILREQMSDEGVRQQVRAKFGEQALNEVSYYASIADRADIDMPEKTRDRMLQLAEKVITDSVLRTIDNQQALGTRAFTSPGQIAANAQAPRIGLDTTPTGTIRVDSQGSAAPETRADTISTRQRVDQMRDQGLTGQTPKGGEPGAGAMVGEGVQTTTQRPLRERLKLTNEATSAQPDVQRTAGVAVQADDGRGDQPAGSRGVVGQLAADPGRGVPQPADAPATSRRTAEPVGDGSGEQDQTLSGLSKQWQDAAAAGDSPKMRTLNDRIVALKQRQQIDAASHEAATSPTNDRPEPTDAQKSAGNYKLGHARISGMDVSIENPKGSTRRSKADEPTKWEVKMPAHYGYIKGTKGADGDHVDLTIGDKGDNGRFWIINQTTPDGKTFDEHKVFTGVDSAEEATALYKQSFSNGFGDKVFGSISAELGADALKAKLPALERARPVPADTTPAPATLNSPAAIQDSAPKVEQAPDLKARVKAKVAAKNSKPAAQQGTAVTPAPSQREAAPINAVAPRSGDSIAKLGRVMQAAGWEIDYVDLDLTGEKPKAEIKVHRGDGRWLWAKVDTQGRASFETFQRESGLGRQKGLKAGASAPLVPQRDDTFLGRQKFEGARSMLRGMTNYLVDNATNKVALEDMRAAWAPLLSDGATIQADAPRLENEAAQAKPLKDRVKAKKAEPAAPKTPVWEADPLTMSREDYSDARYASATNNSSDPDYGSASNYMGMRKLSEWERGFRAKVEQQHFDAADNAAKLGRELPPAALYDYPVFIRDDLSDAERDEASDAMTAVYRQTKDYAKAVKVYREFKGGQKPAAPASLKERVEAAKKPVTEKAQAKADRLTDAGEELIRNRRGKLKGLAWDDVSAMNDTLKVAQVIKSNVWPRPDYAKMVEDGALSWKAAVLKVVYDRIATAPSTMKAPTDEDLKAYIETVEQIRETLLAELDRVEALLGGAADLWKSLKSANVFGKVFPVPSDARPMYGSPSPFDRVSEQGKANNKRAMLIGGNNPVRALQFSSNTLSKVKDLLADGFPAKQEAWQKSYEVRSTETRNNDVPEAERTGEPQQRFYVYEKGSSWRLAKGGQDGGYATLEQAEAFARSLTVKKKEVLPPSRGLDLADVQRTGPDWRKGKNVAAQDLMDEFGFRGVNLGEYVKAKQNIAQIHLNHAYDAFRDLADLLDVPPKAMSLNGSLGLAIGAQGSGKALAHFVPGVNEINITRDFGAGALAHEFGHAVDHYFATQHGKAVSMAKRPYLSAAIEGMSDPGNVRPEIIEAMRTVMRTINRRQMTGAEVKKYMADQRELNQRRMDRWVSEFKGNKGADPAALTAVADKLKQGDIGQPQDGDVESNLAEFMRAAGLKPGNAIAANAFTVAYRLRDLADEARFMATHVPQVDTNYAKASAAMDAKKQGDGYWSTPWEKFARAFETFAMDALHDRERESLYLSGLVDSKGWQDWSETTGKATPYPAGEERLAMQQAFQKLVDTIQTRETDAGTLMFSADDANPAGWASIDGGGSEADTTRYGADPDRNHLRIVGFAQESIAERRSGYLLRAVEAPGSRSDLRAARAIAETLAGHKTIFVKQDNGRVFNGAAFGSPGSDYLLIDVDSSKPVMAVTGHELLHRLRAARPDLYAQLDKRLSAVIQGEGIYAADLRARYEKLELKQLSDEKIHEELIADIFGDEWSDPEFWRELAKDQPKGFRAVVDSVLKFLDDMISKVIKNRPFGTEFYLTDLRAARDAVMESTREFSKGEVGTLDEVPSGLMFDAAAGPTDSAAFRRWFGDSKVVGDDGEPLVVYHGTAADFSEFKTSKYESGIYFTPSTRYAEGRAYVAGRMSGDKQATPLVMPVYLKMENPAPAGYGVDRAKAEGYDGLVRGEGNMKEYVVFRPEQIKSAIGNRGTFDPASSDINLSIADDAPTNIRGFNQQSIRDRLADTFGSAGAKVSWWDKTLGTQYAKAQKYPEFRRVFNHVQSYLEDTSTLANEAADQAPDILPKLETWKDLKHSGISDDDAEAIAAPIFEGTLTEKRVFSDSELRDTYGLSPEQVGLYRQFLATVNTSLDQAVAADVLRLLGDVPVDFRSMAMGNREAMRSGIDRFLAEQIKQAEGSNAIDNRNRLIALREDIRQKYERIDKLKDEGYAPLMRFGKYLVNIADPATGESMFFGLYETKAEANRMARELAEDPQFEGYPVERGVLSQEQYKLFSAVPVESLEMFADAIGADQSPVFQEYLRLAKNNRSALKRLIHRKGTAGFSQDMDRVLAAFVTSNSRLAAGSMNLPAAKDAIQQIRSGDVKDEAIALVDTVETPTDTAAPVRSLMFMNFIGGSLASAVVNLTQPVTMTLPYLSRWGGLAKAAGRLMAAGKVAASGSVSDPVLREALQRAEDDGIVSPQEIHHLQAQAMATFGTNAYAKKLAFLWGAPFSLAEQFNRRVSFIAAFQTAREQGLLNPFEFAENAVIETQGLYNRGNAPNLARTGLGAAALTFKQFSIHYLEWMGRMYRSGPEGKRAVLYALALLMLAAGTDGLPFADDLDDLADTITQALGIDLPAKETRRAFIADTLGLGDEAADVMTRGASAISGFPLDVSLRMGMGNLLPATGILLRSNTDRSRDVLEVAGPAGSLAKQYVDAGQKGLRGDAEGALQSALPVALQNVWKAASVWSTGEYRDSMDRKVMEADEVDGLMKFLGFQPAEIARESQKMGRIRRSEQLAKNVEGEIASLWARGVADSEPDKVAEARQQLADWNETNKDSPIVITTAQIVQRVKKMRQDRSERFIKGVAPERRARVMEEMQ